MLERRCYIRVPIGVEATYQVVEKLIAPRLGISEDLSLGGMRLTQPECLEPGHPIIVTLSLPVEGQVVLQGCVIWCREAVERRNGHKAGIRWVEVSPIAQARLNAFLTQRTRSGFSFSPPPPVLLQPPVLWRNVAFFALVACALLFVFSLSFSLFHR